MSSTTQTIERELAASEPFVGRAAEVLRAEKALANKHIVLLGGAGGVGKTRLARFIADELASSRSKHPLAMTFCDLSDAKSGVDVCAALGRSLGVSLKGQTELDATRQLAHAMAGRGDTIVVLDAVDGCAEAITKMIVMWTKLAPNARFMVTARDANGIAEAAPEILLPLDAKHAAKLFAQQADRAIDEHVEKIVHTIGGMPLAIKLAAAKAKRTKISDLAKRLERRLKDEVKSDRRGDGTRATIEWAYDSLPNSTRRALAQLSVFRGGFTHAAAEAVCAIGREAPLADALSELEESALIRKASRALHPDVRYEIHERVRAFAAEALAKSTDADGASRRHADYFLALAQDLSTLEKIAAARRREQLEDDLANIMSAFVVVLARPPSAEAARDGLRAAIALGPILSARGPIGNDYAVLDLALEFADGYAIDPKLRGNALVARGEVWRVQGRLEEARADLEEARSLAKSTEDQKLEGLAIAALGRVHHSGGRLEEAHTHYERALALARESRDHELEAKTLGNLALVYRMRKRYRDALAHAERALELHRRTGNARLEADLLGVIGTLYQGQTLMEEARDHYERAILLLHEVEEPALEGSVTGNLGTLQHELGDLEGSKISTEHALAIFRRIGAKRLEARAIGQLAAVSAESGKLDDARARYVEAIAILEGLGETSDAAFFDAQLGGVLAAMGRVDEATAMFERAEEAWRASTPPHEGANDWAALQRGHLEIALAKRAAKVGDQAAAKELRAKARARIDALEKGEDAPVAYADDVRVAIRMLKRAMAEDLPSAKDVSKSKKRGAAKVR